MKRFFNVGLIAVFLYGALIAAYIVRPIIISIHKGDVKFAQLSNPLRKEN